MSEPQFNEEERQVLRQAQAMKELMEHPKWKVFQLLLQTHIAARQRILNAPVSSQPQAFRSLDAASKMVELECVKGAIIGLQLALDLPSAILEDAKRIIRENAPSEEVPQTEGQPS